MTITARAIALLREYQWSVDSYGDVCCRCCGEPRDVGKHDIDCTLAAILAEYDRAGEETERDAARMDFMERCVLEHRAISAERDRDPYVNNPTFGNLPTVTFFSVPSQHVRGVGFRGAVDAAIAKEQAP